MNVNGPSYNSVLWTINAVGEWQTGNVNPFINGTYDVYALCTTTQTEGRHYSIEVT